MKSDRCGLAVVRVGFSWAAADCSVNGVSTCPHHASDLQKGASTACATVS